MTPQPHLLLCELHAHTTWSDGSLTVGQLVDLYGQARFDVLCITDHVVRADAADSPLANVHAANHHAYMAAIEIEAERALVQFGMLVLPGLELTYDDRQPLHAAHVVAVGLDRFVGVSEGIEPALAEARRHGAALIAAHPYTLDLAETAPRTTARLATYWRRLAPSIDRWELINRNEVFGWVARAGLPAVATGDAHTVDHLATWKTMLPCAADRDSVIAYLRSDSPAYLIDAGPLAATRVPPAVALADAAA